MSYAMKRELPSLIVRGFGKEMEAALRADAAKLEAMTGEVFTLEFTPAPSAANEIAATVTCAWCDNPVPADSEGTFCSGSCEDADRADGDNFGRDA